MFRTISTIERRNTEVAVHNITFHGEQIVYSEDVLVVPVAPWSDAFWSWPESHTYKNFRRYNKPDIYQSPRDNIPCGQFRTVPY